MAGELEQVANDLMAALDSKDLDRIVGSIGEDAQGVDEISRRWLRGRGELDNYLRQMIGAVSGVRSELRDAQERVWSESRGTLGGHRRTHDPSEVLGREELVWADSSGDDAEEAVRVLFIRPQRAEERLPLHRRRRE